MGSICGCCGCCSALRPRYKRLVDNIFPVNPDDGLVKSNMEKLTFYSLSSPEKLDRIGEYLYQKATKDINRRRYKLVEIAMEAMDSLLIACHAQTLNLFVESFLRMVQKLLEDSNPHLQIMATNSFVRFANIEEDTPSYHRRYDFFISKFSSMCHGIHDDLEMQKNMRFAGIKGLQGVIRKTVSDDLVENIWEKQHMEKIVPSLLFNMQSGPLTSIEEDINPASTPSALAESVLRELVSRASFSHIRAVLKPLLTHLDRHDLWVPNKFAIHTFRIVMISIQPQYSYTVVETLMAHLDQNSSSSPKIKTSIAVVLSKIIAIAAGESVGPSALDIINNLLNHLRTSVKMQQESSPEATLYQEALINALGEFANHHPDYQKIEIMLFIINTVPDLSKTSKDDLLLQSILLKSLLKVGVQYRTTSYEKAFPASFLQPLMKMARAPHPQTRMLVMEIFQALLDRHSNNSVLDVVNLSNYPGLSIEPPSRSDNMFMHKYGARIMQALIDGIAKDDDVDATISFFKTSALLIIEMACTETIQEFLLFILGFQHAATSSDILSNPHKCNLHIVTIVLSKILAKVTGVTNLAEYVEKIIAARQEEVTYLLPPMIESHKTMQNANLNLPHLMLDKLALAEALQASGMEFNRIQTGTPYCFSALDASQRPSWAENMPRSSIADTSTYNNDNDSVGSSPGVIKKSLPSDYNFESMKRMLAEPTERSKREARDKEIQIIRAFRENDFDDLIRRTEPKHDVIQNRLNELFNSLGTERATQVDGKMQKIYENNFPELFFY
ncbi:protein EFR3 homolog cmp44E [Culicoides brevitarsis]|uniref:protein EFR3 homolog cmp44E n=1 Tax=Culicoides brevitarsis TaxID=469753 RepID=UPI00307B4949